MTPIISATLSRMRLAWRQILAVHLIFSGLGIIVFAPLLGILGQALLKLSGEPALADMDLLFFALSPTGFFALLLFAAVTIVISAFGLAAMLAIAMGGSRGKTVDVFAALVFSFGRAGQIFHFAARLVFKLLLLVVPFLLAGAAIAYALISEYDINYYLSVQPPVFWTAAIVIGLLLVTMSILLVRRLVRWSLALPLVLFAGALPAQSFAASEKLTQKNTALVFWSLVVWGAATLLLGVVVTVAVQFLAASLVPLFINSVTFLAILFGLLTALWSIASALTTALAAGSLAMLLTILSQALDPRLQAIDLQPARQRTVRTRKATRRLYLVVLVTMAGAAAFLGSMLLDEISIADKAKIIAHRGASGAAPENTMASIRRAIADGADWIEIDVQETADGEVVVIHDSDFMKLAGVNLKVWEATTERLAEIDIGGWFAPEFADARVPTLAAVLAEVKGQSRLIVELKYYGHDQRLEQRVIDLIEAAEMQDDTMLMSLEYAGIQKVRALRPDWKVGLLSARAAGDLTRLDADFLAVNMALARPALIKAAHAAGKEIYVWTINDALSMSQLMSLGVDGVITDEPLLGREVLTARSELSSTQRLLLHMAPLFGLEAPSLGMESNDAGTDSAAIDVPALTGPVSKVQGTKNQNGPPSLRCLVPDVWCRS